MMRLEEARIAAHVCGDGWLCSYIEKNSLQIVNGRRYHRDRRKYEVGYCNTNKALLDQFASDMAKIFNVKPRRKSNEVRVRSKRIFERVKFLGAGNTYEWKIGPTVKNSSKRAKNYWLRAFFDDEATVENNKQKRIRVKSMNFKGLNSVRKMLSELGIHGRITGPNIDNSWYLSLSGLEAKKFILKIGFDHTEKKLKSEKLYN